jgi:hypothetical protein
VGSTICTRCGNTPQKLLALLLLLLLLLVLLLLVLSMPPLLPPLLLLLLLAARSILLLPVVLIGMIPFVASLVSSLARLRAASSPSLLLLVALVL